GGPVRGEGSGRGSAASVDPGDRERDLRRGGRAHGLAAVLAAAGLEGAPGRERAGALGSRAEDGCASEPEPGDVACASVTAKRPVTHTRSQAPVRVRGVPVPARTTTRGAAGVTRPRWNGVDRHGRVRS